MSASNGATARFPEAFLAELRDRYPLASAVQEAVQLKREGKRWKGLCPFHAEKTASFTVFPDNRFKCFGCGADGDVFTYVEKRHGVKFPEAVEHVADAAGVPLPDTYTPRARPLPAPLPPPAKAAPVEAEDWRPMVPPPADAPPPPAALLRCDTLHTYRGTQGELLCYVRRIEARGNKPKLFLPLTYGTLDGRTGWHERAPDTRRPLYGLDKLAARPDAPVMIHEGEKKADAAQWLFPDRVCVAWSGGSGAVEKADWTPLKERRTGKIMWPDNDAPGRDAAAKVAALLPGVRVLRVEDLPPGADAADVQPDNPEAWLRDRLPPEPGVEPPLPLLWFEDIAPVLDASDFVQGVLTEGSAAVVYGESGAGKTFWVTDLALHVATGKRWNDRRVEQGGVIYCALEGNKGFRNRVSAWRQDTLIPDGLTPFAAVESSLNLLDPEADTPRLIATIQAAAKRMGQPVKLVVVDTLSRAMAGGNENAPDDMGALVGNMDAIRAATGACVLFVHHSGKDAAKGARGHSLLRAAVDTEIEVRADEASGSATATLVKQRELTKGAAFGFRLETKVLGQNRHGEDVTSCVVTPEIPCATKDKRGLTDTELAWMRDLTDMFAEPDLAQKRSHSASGASDLTLTRDQVRAGFRRRGRFACEPDANLTGADRERLRAMLNKLRDKGRIAIADGLIWLVDQRQAASGARQT